MGAGIKLLGLAFIPSLALAELVPVTSLTLLTYLILHHISEDEAISVGMKALLLHVRAASSSTGEV